MSACGLTILAKAPQLGQVKTRLATTLGPAAALAIYGQLLAATARAARGWGGTVRLLASGDAWAGTGLELLPRQPQPAGGLGTRIAAALAWGLEDHARAMVIGTDCPGLTAAHLAALAAAASAVPVAFGPACDGGFWGMAIADRRALVALNDELPWSTPAILAALRARLQDAGLGCALADVLPDCDEEPDWRAAVAAGLLPELP